MLPSGNVTYALYDTIEYTCIVPQNSEVQWLVNGTILEDMNLPGVRTASNIVAGALTITNLTEVFNETTVQCKSTSRTGDVLLSDTPRLRLQGN